MLKELEFKNEATNMMPVRSPRSIICRDAECAVLLMAVVLSVSHLLRHQIRKNLETSGIAATTPLVIPALVTSRVLVMQFISGHKLNEFGVLRREGADLRELTAIVCDALGYQMYVHCTTAGVLLHSLTPHTLSLWSRGRCLYCRSFLVVVVVVVVVMMFFFPHEYVLHGVVALQVHFWLLQRRPAPRQRVGVQG